MVKELFVDLMELVEIDMPLYNFKCDVCDNEFEERFFLLDGEWYYAPEEGEDVNLGLNKNCNIEFWYCKECGNNEAPRLLFTPGTEGPAAKVKGITDRSLRQQRRFEQYGMDRSAAETFYKESIEASRERISKMKEVYKKVSPDMDYHIKKGNARLANDTERQRKEVQIKRNAEGLINASKGKKK